MVRVTSQLWLTKPERWRFSRRDIQYGPAFAAVKHSAGQVQLLYFFRIGLAVELQSPPAVVERDIVFVSRELFPYVQD